MVHSADIQDRDGVFYCSRFIRDVSLLVTLFSDAGYQGPQFATAVADVLPHLSVEIGNVATVAMVVAASATRSGL